MKYKIKQMIGEWNSTVLDTEHEDVMDISEIESSSRTLPVAEHHGVTTEPKKNGERSDSEEVSFVAGSARNPMNNGSANGHEKQHSTHTAFSEQLDSVSQNSSLTEEMMSTTKLDLTPMMNDSNVDHDEEMLDVSANAGILNIQGIRNTQARCFICQSKEGRKATPWTAIQQAWFQKLAYVPKSNRICDKHLTTSNKFDEESLQKIEESKQCVSVKNEEFEVWLHKISDLPQPTIYNFEEDGIEGEKYKMFFGISKQNFDDLVQYLHGRVYVCLHLIPFTQVIFVVRNEKYWYQIDSQCISDVSIASTQQHEARDDCFQLFDNAASCE